MGPNEFYYLSDKTAGYGRRTRARGMDPAIGLLVDTESNYLPKKENRWFSSVFLCLFPVETTDWIAKTYGRERLAADLQQKAGRILRDPVGGSVRLEGQPESGG